MSSDNCCVVRQICVPTLDTLSNVGWPPPQRPRVHKVSGVGRIFRYLRTVREMVCCLVITHRPTFVSLRHEGLDRHRGRYQVDAGCAIIRGRGSVRVMAHSPVFRSPMLGSLNPVGGLLCQWGKCDDVCAIGGDCAGVGSVARRVVCESRIPVRGRLTAVGWLLRHRQRGNEIDTMRPTQGDRRSVGTMAYYRICVARVPARRNLKRDGIPRRRSLLTDGPSLWRRLRLGVRMLCMPNEVPRLGI